MLRNRKNRFDKRTECCSHNSRDLFFGSSEVNMNQIGKQVSYNWWQGRCSICGYLRMQIPFGRSRSQMNTTEEYTRIEIERLASRHGQDYVNSPRRPRHRECPQTPSGYIDQHERADNDCQAYRQGAPKQGLCYISDHCPSRSQGAQYAQQSRGVWIGQRE